MDEQQQDATVANLAPTLPVMGTAGLTPTLTPTGASMPNTPPLESTTNLGIRKALDAQSARSKNATNASLFGAVQQDPDGTARLQALARKLGVPTGTVALDEERANVEQKLREIRALNLAENAPNLSKRLGDPEFANIAYDDLQPLSRWEQLFDWVTDTSGVKAQAVNTMLQTEESKFWVRMMNANMGSRQELSGYPEEQKRWDFYMSRQEDPIDSLAEGAAYLGAQLYSTADEVASYAVAGGLVGGAVGAAGGLGIGSMATAPAGAAVGMSYGAGIGMFTSMSKLEAGLLYKDLLRNKVDPDDARVYAMYAGMGMGALEFASFKMMSAPLRASLKAYMKKEIAKRTMKGAVGTAVKGYAQGVGAEIGTELLQENLSIATEEASRRFSKGKYEPLFTWDGGSRYLQRMGDVAQQTFTTVALFGGLGPSAKFAVDYANVRQTERTAAFLNDVANTSKDSKLRARAPNAFLEYLAKQSEGKPAETMYVNAERLREILRKSELTGGEIDQALPGVRAKLEETLTSADIEIPTAQFATTAVGTVLEEPILMAARLDPKAHSVEQLIALQAEQVEYLRDAEATLIAQVETNANAVVEAEAVHTAAKVAFVAAGREETQAHADAMFYRAYIIRLAGELKISVAEAARLFPLPTIVGVGQAAAASTLAPARPSGAVATSPAAATTNAAEALPPVSPVTAESLREVATANVASTTATMQQVRDSAVAERRLTSSQLKANEAGEAAVQQWIRENRAAYARFKADRDFVAGKSEAPSTETSEQERARVEDASDTLEQAAKPDRSTNQAAIPTTVDDAANLAAAQAIASSKSWDTGRNLKLALQESVLAAANNAGVDPSLVSPQRLEYLIRIGTADALKALADNKEAVGWYDAKCMEALAIAALIYPELKTNANARFAYIWALAVTSNGMKVDMNFQLADSVYKYFKENNEFPTNITAGQAQKNINKSLAAFNLMRKEFGIDNLRKFMQTEMTLKQVNALASGDLKASGEHAGTLVNGSAILGPKIGNGFFSNLYGRFDKLTMDRWLVRTWGRWTGTLIEIDQPLLNKARERMAEVRTKVNASASERALVLDVLQDVLAKKEFKERRSLITQLKALAKLKKPKAAQLEKMVELRAQIAAFGDLDQLVIDRFASVSDDAFAIAIQKQSQDQTRRADLSKTDIGNEVRLAANSLAKYADGQKEAPSGPFERQDIREVFEGMLANLRKDPRYSDLTMADLQAVLWYAEKRLYENAKEDTVAGERDDAYEPDEAPDYSNASAKVARERGITNEQINAAIKEAHDERARKQKTQALVRAEGDKSGSTESGERGSGRVERTGSESERTSALVEAASKIDGGFTPKELVTFQRDVATRGARRISQHTKGQSGAYHGRMVGDAGGVRRLTAFGGTARTVWAADAALTKVWTPVGIPSLELFELEPTMENASAFADLIAKARVAHKFGMSVALYPVADYAGMRLFVTENGASGFALKPDGDIISAFSNGGNAAAAMLQTAVAAGGTKLDAFDTVLPEIYASHGFRAVARVKWDDAEAPEGWDKAAYRKFNGGEPDVVMMVLDRDYFGWYVPADGSVMSYPNAVAEQTKQQAQLNQPKVEESTTFQQAAFAEQPWGSRSQIRDESGELETVYHGTSQTADQTGFFTNDKNDGTNFDETADESDWDAAVAEVNRAHKQIALLMSPAQHALWEQVFGGTIAEYVVTKDALSDDAQETGQPMEAMDNARDSVIEVIKPDADLLASIIARFDRAKKEAGITRLTGATVMPVNLDVVYPLIVEVSDTQQFDEIKTVALAEMDVYVHDGIVFNMPDGSRVYFVPTEEQVQPAASTFFQQDVLPAPAPAKFFSNLTRVVSTVPLDNASAGDWMKLFKKLAGQGTIRNDEIEWTFLEEWLDAQVGLVSKDSVLDYLEKNGVEIEVSPLVGQSKPVRMENKWVVESEGEQLLGPFETESEAIQAVAEKSETLALNQYDEAVGYIRRRAKDAGGSDQDQTVWVIEGDGFNGVFNTEEEAKNWLMGYFRNDAANWAETVNIVQRNVPQVNREWRVYEDQEPTPNIFNSEEAANAFVEELVKRDVLTELRGKNIYAVKTGSATIDDTPNWWTVYRFGEAIDETKFQSKEEAEQYLFDTYMESHPNAGEMFDIVEEEQDQDSGETPLKYTRWQLGESQVNSQEVLITLPNAYKRPKGFIDKDLVDGDAQREKVGEYYDEIIDKEFLARQDLRRNGPSDPDEKIDALGKADRRIRALQRKRRYEQNKILRKNPSTSPTSFRSTHWDDLNVLVHIRTNDRVDSQGRRILFIEEIQSDSGQTGHKEGFYFPWFNNVEVSPTEFKVTDVDGNHYTVQNIKTGVEAVYFDMDSETDALETAAEDAMARASLPKHTGVMRMPFIESTGSWVTLALKQILLQAVNGNYDGVSFIDGKESSERYTLSRFVKSVRVFGNADGTWNLEITALQADGNNQPIIEKRNNLTPDNLELHVGAELAKLMIARQGKPETSATGQETHVYDGDKLKLVSKGMVKFYDEVVPSMTNKLSSKFGGGKLRAGEVMVDGSEYAILTLDLTQSLKAQVSNGLPLFQSTAGIPPRGEFDPIKNLMKLSNKADSSTVMHEMAHWFLVTTMNAALNPAASARMLEDADMTLKWFGIASATASERLANWHSMSLEQQRKYHESFAYNFEIYLYTGKAPSVELQTTFDKFRVWLANVYASIRDDLNVLYRNRFGEDLPFLNEEVRGVFDRLIASEEQISRREEVDNFKASYESQEESGMNDAEWFEFKRLEKEAHDQSVAELTAASLKAMGTLSNGRGRMLASLQAKFNSTRRRIRREVLEAMAVEPARVAERFLKYGIRRNVDGVDEKTTSTYKLNRFAPGIDVDKLRRMISKDGVAPDLIADSLGYSSGDELVKAMNALPPMDEEADARTDARMTAEYGELNTPEARETAVDQAMHTEARGRFVAVEFQFLAKVSKPVATILAGAKEIARTILGKTKIKDIKPHNHALAEARVAREKRTAQRNMQSPETAKKTATTRSYNKQVADGVDPVAAKAESERVGEDAFARATERHAAYEKENGVRPEVAAIKASHQQVIQHQLAREAQEIRDEVDSALRKFKKIFQADAKLAKGRNMALVMTARTILAHYQLGRRGVMPAEYLEQLKEYNPDLHAQVVQLTQGAENASRPYKELTVTEFRIMRDAVLALWQQSQRDQMMLVEGRLMRRDEAVKQLVARLYEIRQSDEVPGTTAALSANDLRKQTLLGLSALLKIPESWAYTMDGLNKNMPFTRFIFRPIRAAVDEYNTAVTVHITKFRDIITKWRGDGIEVRKIHSDELNYTFGSANGGLAKVEIVGALMHTGNESNYRKLLLGRGWATLDEEGNLDSSRWDAFVQRMIADGVITKRDYDFVQSVWDLNEEVKPIAQKAHYTMYGYYFQEVEATPFTNEFGTYRGGYVPAKTESTMARDALRHATAEELASDFRQEIPSTTRGFTKSRVEYNQPLSLDVGLMPSHLTSVLRFAIIQPAITDVLRLIKDESFKSKMNTVDRAAIDRILIPWLSRVATQRKTTAGIHPAVDAFWAGVRRNAGQSIMFANIRNALQQLTGLSPSLTRVKHRYLYAAIANYMANPNASAGECARLSPYMEQRLNSQMFELTEQIETALANPSAYDNIKTWFAKHSYFLQTAMQSPVDVITWWGKYNEVIAEAPLGADPEQTKAEAISQASATVRMTQGALDSTSVSSSQVGSPFYQTLIQFSSWGNMMANLNAANYVRIARDMGFKGNAGLLLHQYVFGFLAVAVVCEIMVKGLSGKLGDDDDDGYLDTVLDVLIGSQFRLGSSFVPGGGGAASLMMSGFTDAQWDDRMSSSPSVSALESSWKATDIVRNTLDPKKEITGKNVNDVATLVSLITSIPAKGFARPISYLVDVNRGAVEPTSSIDFVRGLVTGSASPASKDN